LTLGSGPSGRPSGVAAPYVPHTDEDRAAMLARVGAASVDELADGQIPPGLRLRGGLNLPGGKSELEVLRELSRLAASNAAAGAVCFAGGGVYDHHVPAAAQALLSRGEFLTAYTPYQPEISQGTLQATFEFQTAICELTGMDVANASHYDGATATAEAALLACAATGRSRVAVDRAGLHPHYRQVLETYARGRGVSVDGGPPDGAAACLVVQQPDYAGRIVDVARAARSAHGAGALLVVVADPSTLGVLEAPGRQGADLVVGDGQTLGLPMGFGGPTVGYFAAREPLLRRLPGRIAGQACDAAGREGYVLTLQAREQHIRRARATSNICTNQAFCALASLIHLTLLGPEGLREVGLACLSKTRYAAGRLRPFLMHPDADHFKEFVVQAPPGTASRLLERGYLVGPEVEGGLLVAFTEKRTRAEIDGLVEVLASCLSR
jgi:glycine dehydrogenase subunit 1